MNHAETPAADSPAPGQSPATSAKPAKPARFLRAERTGRGTYTGRNERGATVAIGPEGEAGVFSPGELLAVAVAACTGMSAEARLTFELGDDVPICVDVERVKVDGENRYERFAVELLVAAAQQDPARRKRMFDAAAASIARSCTVSRTLSAGATTSVSYVTQTP